ncbi:variant 3, bZIP transcription factor 18, partial [Lathyrus oleraceus]
GEEKRRRRKNPGSNRIRNNNNTTMSSPFHRRSQSEVHFRIPDDFDLEMDPFDFDASPLHFQDPQPHDDLLSSYIDSENSGSKLNSPPANGDTGRPGHRRSNSADTSSSMLSEGIESKKAMSPDKLAQLWTVDPKRAKSTNCDKARRLTAVKLRQSAAVHLRQRTQSHCTSLYLSPSSSMKRLEESTCQRQLT